MHFNGLKLSGFFKEEYNVLVQKCKNQLFEEIKRFERINYRIEVQVITNLSSRLEKHQTLDILLMTDFS